MDARQRPDGAEATLSITHQEQQDSARIGYDQILVAVAVEISGRHRQDRLLDLRRARPTATIARLRVAVVAELGTFHDAVAADRGTGERRVESAGIVAEQHTQRELAARLDRNDGVTNPVVVHVGHQERLRIVDDAEQRRDRQRAEVERLDQVQDPRAAIQIDQLRRLVAGGPHRAGAEGVDDVVGFRGRRVFAGKHTGRGRAKNLGDIDVSNTRSRDPTDRLG